MSTALAEVTLDVDLDAPLLCDGQNVCLNRQQHLAVARASGHCACGDFLELWCAKAVKTARIMGVICDNSLHSTNTDDLTLRIRAI